MKRKVFKIVLRAFVCVFAILLMVTLPAVSVTESENFALILKAFTHNKSDFQGVIEVWNIDEFESGTKAKSSYLKTIAISFQRQNKGAYVLVRDLTEFECLTLLETGARPDIFSCSYNMAKKIQDYIQPYSSSVSEFQVEEKFLEAGTVGESLYGVAWCLSVYMLFSTTDKLADVGVSLGTGQNLSSVALSSYAEVETKSGTKIINSLTFGASGFHLTENVFNSYTNTGTDLAFGLAVDEESYNQSAYDAYVKFISGKSTILLGTLRDLVRLQGRLDAGKISNLIYEFVSSSSDLVQFCFISKSTDSKRTKASENFVKMITSLEKQKKISEIGLLSVANQANPYESGIMSDITPQIFSDFKVYKLFE